MGCGCKNKNNQPTTPQQQVKTQQTKSNNVNESIKKIVEKYYNNKK
jgi:hypothetical protein